MKIRVLPRIFFEKIKGTAEEDRLLENYRIISINSGVYLPNGGRIESLLFIGQSRRCSWNPISVGRGQFLGFPIGDLTGLSIESDAVQEYLFLREFVLLVIFLLSNLGERGPVVIEFEFEEED